MIPNESKGENLSFPQKDSSTGQSGLNLSSWAGELKRKIASSEEQTASLRTRAELLRSRADALLKEATAADANAQALRNLLQNVEQTEKSLVRKFHSTFEGSTSSDSDTLAGQVRRRAREILKAVGRPLGRTEIFSQLLEDGIVINSANPAQRVGKILWQSDEFEYLKSENGYWLKGEAITNDAKREKRFRAPNRKKNSF